MARTNSTAGNTKRVKAYAAVAVEIAARRGTTLRVGTEAKRLLADYPDCAIEFEDLRDQLARQASQKGVTVEFN